MTKPEQELTVRQRKTLDVIVQFFREHGYAPTNREIGRELGITVNAVRGLLSVLERKGYVIRDRRKARAMKVTKVA